MGSAGRRRFVVKGYASSPGWSGCTFAYACSTLRSAERCFAKKSEQFTRGEANADAILLIDREERSVIAAIGADDPVKVADWFGW